MKNFNGPLKGVQVLELAHIMAGPVCGLMLADLGADVIKVEKLPGGDDSRQFVPPEINGESAAFMMMNRNKRGIAIDLKKASGKKVAQRLIKKTDILIENYRAGTMDRLGLNYEVLKKTNPGLIYCEISGFGRTGPYKERAGFDLIAQGMSGLMSITGEGPNKDFVKVGSPVTDITSGILAAMGVLSAYIDRLKTGTGQKIDTSLFEAGIVQTYWQSAIALATDVSPAPMGSAHPLNAPYQAYKTKNGWITLGAANQKNWVQLTQAINRPDLAENQKFTTNKLRMKNLKALNKVLNKVFLSKTQKEWLGILESMGIPAGPILSIKEMLSDPHTIERNMVPSPHHSKLGPTKTIGCPVKFSKTPSKINIGAPMFGEHTRIVLGEAGFSNAEINQMIREGVIAG